MVFAVRVIVKPNLNISLNVNAISQLTSLLRLRLNTCTKTTL